MNNVVKAFAPANISCIFKILKEESPAKSGSIGLGFTLSQGVVAKVFACDKTEVFLNGKKIKFPTVVSVVSLLTGDTFGVKIILETKLPLGCGFGLSGASALAAAYAVNKLFNLKKENIELAKIAHVAEVVNNTGLGDVVNQYFGGFILKTVSSFEFKVKQLPILNLPVYIKVFGKLDTKKILSSNNFLKINNAADTAIDKISKIDFKKDRNNNFADIINISLSFAEKSKLLNDKAIIKEIIKIKSTNGFASMVMLGKAIFSNVKFSGAEEYIISNNCARLI